MSSLKDEYGRAGWTVLHRYARVYPDNPNTDDKEEFHRLLRAVIRGLPNEDCKCRSHAISYVKNHKPDMSSKKSLTNWLCEFHNDVNKRTGKKEQDCKVIIEKPSTCVNCTSTGKEKETVAAADIDGPIKQAMSSFRNVSTKVFEELCKKENIPVPTVKYAPCPKEGTGHTSCTLGTVKKSNTNLELFDKKELPVIYLNPSQYSLRTLAHEFSHYRAIMKGESKTTLTDENKAHKDAIDIIKKHFPSDVHENISSGTLPKSQLLQPIIAKDSIPIPSNTIDDTIKSLDAKISDPSYFPLLSKYSGNKIRKSIYYDDSQPKSILEQQIENEGVEAKKEEEPKDEGFLKVLDPLFEPMGKHFGLSARDLNNANLPPIISQIVNIIVNSNMSSIGGLLVTSLAGLGLFGITAMQKDSLGLPDRKLLTQLGGNIMWSGLKYAGPKEHSRLLTDFDVFVSLIKQGKYLDAVKVLLESPSQKKMKDVMIYAREAQVDPTLTPQQQLINQRKLQRSAGGGQTTGPGGLGTSRMGDPSKTGLGLSPTLSSASGMSGGHSSRFGVPGTGDSSEHIPSSLIRELAHARSDQRAMGLDRPVQEDVFHNFSNPTVPIGGAQLPTPVERSTASINIRGESPSLTYIPGGNYMELDPDVEVGVDYGETIIPTVQGGVPDIQVRRAMPVSEREYAESMGMFYDNEDDLV